MKRATSTHRYGKSSHRSRGRWLLAVATLGATLVGGCNGHRLMYEALSRHYNAGSADPLEQRRHYQETVEAWQTAHETGELPRR